ncbi:MAG: mechanosensitive ion channel [Oscillospiraceae bacterium]|nr:mechanosensitive ion channel [Oscillospiraceae bacterium]
MFEQIAEKIKEWAPSLEKVVLDNILPAIILLVIGLLVIRIIMSVIKKILANSKLEKAAHTLVKSLASAAMYLILGLIVASKMGIDVTGIIALASVLTLAISLSVQNMLTNVIGGFTLLYTKPFHSGDYVDVGSKSGTVTEIGMTYTKLRTPDQKVISIPNAIVVAGDIVNYSTSATRRLDIPARAAYCVPTEKVLSALLDAGKVDKVLTDPAPMAVITNYGESAIEYSLRVWVNNADYWDVMFAINKNVKKVFDEQDIKMAYPHIYVHTK